MRADRAANGRAALRTVVAASAVPYGYTVSIWSSGSVLMDRRGMPDVLDVLLFVVGALSGFVALGLLARAPLGGSALPAPDSERVRVGMLHRFAVGVAVGAVALLAGIPGRAAWGLGSFAATSLYLLGASLEHALIAGRPRA
jgi:hypothetical protein